jgi:hypothetical protein
MFLSFLVLAVPALVAAFPGCACGDIPLLERGRAEVLPQA